MLPDKKNKINTYRKDSCGIKHLLKMYTTNKKARKGHKLIELKTAKGTPFENNKIKTTISIN